MNPPPLPSARPVKPLSYPTRSRSVFRTLLWAEIEPRRSVLRFVLLLLVLFALQSIAILIPGSNMPDFTISDSDTSSFPSPPGLIVAGILYCAISQGGRSFSARPTWHSMVLPVAPLRFLLPRLVFQTGLALILGMLWSLNHIGIVSPPPVAYALGVTLAFTIQLQAALLWWAAAGAQRGFIAYIIGLVPALALGLLIIVVAGFDPLNVMAPILILGGYLECYRAARAMRGGNIPALPMLKSPALAGMLEWMALRSRERPAFRSRLTAQIWFEWRRSARWIPLIVAVGAGLTIVIETAWYWKTGTSFSSVESYDDSLFLKPSAAAFLLITASFWFIHLSVTRPYRNFVFSLPNTTHRVGNAKMVATVLAVLSMIAISGVASSLTKDPHADTTAHETDSPALYGLQSAIETGGIQLLSVAYGPTLIIPMMFDMVLWIIRDRDMGTPSNYDWAIDGAFLLIGMAIPLIVLTSIAGVLLRRVNLRAQPIPWEIGLAFLLALGLYGAAVVETLSQTGPFWYTTHQTIGPSALMISILIYGLRAQVIAGRTAIAVLAGFTLLLYTFPAAPTPDDPMLSAGYWIMLAGAVPVLYPMVIGWQREEQERQPLSKGTSGALLFFLPSLWIALHLLGEDLSNENREA